MSDILEVLRTNLTSAKAAQENSANANRSPAPAYQAGDEVYLDTRNITTNRPTKKFDSRFIECKIKKVLDSHSYQLELPFEHGLMHDTFHPSLLKPKANNPLPGQTNPPPPPITIDESGEKLWAVEAILDSELHKSFGFRYLVLWRGYDPEDQTWEPLRNVVNARASILEFERRFPAKLKPTKTQITRAKRALQNTTSEILQKETTRE
jgi:hypothetical protein